MRLSGGKYLLTALYHRCHQNKNNFPGLELAKTQASRQKPIIQRETSTATHDALCFGRGAVPGGARHPPSPPCEGAGRRGVRTALSRLLPRGQWRSEEPAGPLAAPAELAGLGALGALPDGACLLRRGCFGVAGACVCVCAPCSHFLVVSCEPGAPVQDTASYGFSLKTSNAPFAVDPAGTALRPCVRKPAPFPGLTHVSWGESQARPADPRLLSGLPPALVPGGCRTRVPFGPQNWR